MQKLSAMWEGAALWVGAHPKTALVIFAAWTVAVAWLALKL